MMNIEKLNKEHLQIISDMTVKLVELRQNECKHLCIENAAPEIFHNLIRVYMDFVFIEGCNLDLRDKE